jgi:hypothetical protein
MQAESAGEVSVTGLSSVLSSSIGRWFRLSSTGASSEGAPSPRLEDRGDRVRLSSSDLEEERRSWAEEAERAVRYPRTAALAPSLSTGVQQDIPSALPSLRGAALVGATQRVLSVGDISDLQSMEAD